MEARDEPPYRMQMNPYAGWTGLGERTPQREAQYPTVAGPVVGAAMAGRKSSLPQEISMGPQSSGRADEGDDVGTTPVEKSDHLIVVPKPGNAGGAKGVAS
jgi:hypothetical protein